MQLRRRATGGGGGDPHPMGAEAVREDMRHVALRRNLHFRIVSAIKGGTFSGQALAVGDSITFSHEFRITSAGIASDSTGLRFGLGNSSNTYAFLLGTGTAPGKGFTVWPVDQLSGGGFTTLTTTGTRLPSTTTPLTPSS
jgi:hypothetical protein